MPTEAKPRTRRKKLYRRAADWLLRYQGSPYKVAMGFAVGIFVALTPTVGIQMILGGVIAHIFRANRAIAVALAWITNPLTIGPIYYFNYRVGLLFLPGDPAKGREFVETISTASLSRPGELWDVAVLTWHELWGVAGVLWAGSLVVAAVCGVVSYPVVWRIVVAERAKLERIRARKSLEPPPPNRDAA